MDIESRKPMQKDAIFRIMSMTKPVVGVSIMMMIEEGKVRLTDPVSKFIPEMKGLQVAVTMTPAGPPPPANAPARFYTVPAEREITVRDLLTHTSGLVSGGISNREAQRVALKGKETLADYLPRLGGVPLDFQPGHALGVQRAGRLRHARANRRDHVRDAIRQVCEDNASSIRSG